MNSQESKKYSVKDLEKLNVVGVGGLRDLVVKNKIFKGIANLKKKQIIEDILSSEWWKTNGISEENKEEKEEKENKENKEEKEFKTEQPKTLKECLTQKQKLRNEIRELERRIKDRDKVLKQKQDEEKKQEDEIREQREKRKEQRKERKEKKKVESVLNTKETQTDEIKENEEIKKDLEDIEEKINKDVGEIKEVETQTDGTQTDEMKTQPKTSNVIETQTEPLSHSPHTEGLISHKEEQKKNVDVGHTIVNVYCGGHQSPNYPVPQYVVRQALNSNNLPLHQQQEIGNMMKQEAPQFTQAPPQAPPQAPQFTQAPPQAPQASTAPTRTTYFNRTTSIKTTKTTS